MFSAGKDKPGASSTTAPKRSEFSKKEKEGRGAFLGGLIGHTANAVITGFGMFIGFRTMGPAGMAGGALAGQAASETAKHYMGSLISSKSSTGAAASFSNVGELKVAVATEAKRAVDEGDNSVASAQSRLEAALETINRATDGSDHSDVQQMKDAVAEAISLCKSEVLTASQSAQQKAGAWAGGL